MADVKWIKITTDMFDNRKIKHLRKLPEGNSIVLIWVMLLTMAGRCNANGIIFLTENIPYTPKMLADELDFEESTIQLALNALEQLNMIVTDNGFFTIAGWGEYQNVEGMEKVREQNRIRQKNWYDRQKALPNVIPNVSITQPNATDIDKEIDIDTDIDKEEESILLGAKKAPTPPAPPTPPKTPVVAPLSPTVISILLNDGSEYPITQNDVDNWAKLYQAVNIMQELRKMKGWADANPKKRKTKGGIKRFINSWLAKEQDKYHPPTESYKPGSNAGSSNIFLDMLNERGGTP